MPRCASDRARPASAWLRRVAVAVAGIVVACGQAEAHKSSDSYLQIATAPGRLDVRWDIALRDLDVALDLDSDGDGKLTWGEIRTAWPRIQAYAEPRLTIAGCPLAPSGRGLERRNDGAYAVLYLRSTCALDVAPRIGYALFAEVDPTHRGIAKVERPGQGVRLLVLEPRVGATAGSTAAMAASDGAPASTGASASRGPAADATVESNAAPTRWQFLAEGVRHILGGYDHVLFLLCLLLPAVTRRTAAGWVPVARMRDAVLPIAGIVTAFTLAHSITLTLAALQLVSLPSAFIEPAIAVTIILAAIDNVRPLFPVPRIVVTFCFGLIHGFGFAGVLSELHLPSADFAWALLQFNLGLEVGQLLVVIAATSLLFAARHWRGYRAVVIRGGSFVAMAVAALWLIERLAGVAILPF